MNKDRHGGSKFKVWANTSGIVPQYRVKEYSGAFVRQTLPEFIRAVNPEQGACVYGETAYLGGRPVAARVVLALFDPSTYIEVLGPSGRKSQWENAWTEEIHNEGQWATYQRSDGVLMNDFGLTWPVLGEIAMLLVIDGEFTIKPTLQSDEEGYAIVSILSNDGDMYILPTHGALAAYVAGQQWEPASVEDLSEIQFQFESENYKVLGPLEINQRGGFYKTGTRPLSSARSRRLTVYDYEQQVSVAIAEVFYAIDQTGNTWRGQYDLGYGLFDINCDGRYFDQIDVAGNLYYPAMGRVSAQEAALYDSPYSIVVLWDKNPRPCTIFLPPVPGLE